MGEKEGEAPGLSWVRRFVGCTTLAGEAWVERESLGFLGILKAGPGD